jgi:hypothetical protein
MFVRNWRQREAAMLRHNGFLDFELKQEGGDRFVVSSRCEQVVGGCGVWMCAPDSSGSRRLGALTAQAAATCCCCVPPAAGRAYQSGRSGR